MLKQFWDAFLCAHGSGAKMVGFNIFGFDLPFLMRRSWTHGVKVPSTIMTFGGRYFCDTFIDLMNLWKCGSYKDFISLDALSRYLGVGSKIGSGDFFYQMATKDPKAAIAYLQNDVWLTACCAKKMGMIA